MNRRWRQRAEAWTWELMAALAERAPVVQLIETHAGGGQYDTVEAFVDVAAPAALAVRCNRPGRVHVERSSGEEALVLDLLTDIDHGRPVREAADALVVALGGLHSGPNPVMAASVRLMATALAAGMGNRDDRMWEWRSGYGDSSLGSQRREDLFRAVPAADAACEAEPGDLLGVPEYRFWFLLVDGEAVLGLEPALGRLFLERTVLAVDAPGATDAWTAVVAPPAVRSDRSPSQRMAAERAGFGPIAQRLAEEVAGTVRRFVAGRRLTRRCDWFETEDGERLLAVVGEHEPYDAADEVLAYALAWQQDRDVALILPESHVGLTLERLPWIETPVRVFTYGAERAPRPAVVPARPEVLAASRSRPIRRDEEHDLGPLAPAAEALRRWADRHWALVPTHRSSYLAWHCAGRQVLQLQRRGQRLHVVAGVAYSGTPPAGEPQPARIDLDGPPTMIERAEIEAGVAGAVHGRLSGRDRGAREHRFQAALAVKNLGVDDVTAFVREYPAWRGPGRPGFVDFLALDSSNRMWVVETKVGSDDVAVMLQALDYATWVTANAAEIRRALHWPAARGRDVAGLHFILAAKRGGHVVGSYLAGQLEALAGDVTWRLSLVTDPDADPLQVESLAPRAYPAPGPRVVDSVRPPRWARRVQASRAAFQADVAAALLPEAHAAFASLVERGLDHRFALHVRSSQAFALNLFAPLEDAGVRAVLRRAGLDVERADPVEFEWRDAADRLAEARPESPHTTQVDVVLGGTTAAGERVAALIEVKFTETDFGRCSAYTNPANPYRHVCRSAGAYGSEPEQCFQLLNHGAGRRRYDAAFGASTVALPSGISDDGGCAVRLGRNQPMRNLAMAHILVGDAAVGKAVFAFCAPSGHRAIWRRFREFREIYPGDDACGVVGLRSEDIAAAHPDGGAAFTAMYPAISLP